MLSIILTMAAKTLGTYAVGALGWGLTHAVALIKAHVAHTNAKTALARAEHADLVGTAPTTSYPPLPNK